MYIFVVWLMNGRMYLVRRVLDSTEVKWKMERKKKRRLLVRQIIILQTRLIENNHLKNYTRILL